MSYVLVHVHMLRNMEHQRAILWLWRPAYPFRRLKEGPHEGAALESWMSPDPLQKAVEAMLLVRGIIHGQSTLLTPASSAP